MLAWVHVVIKAEGKAPSTQIFWHLFSLSSVWTEAKEKF